MGTGKRKRDVTATSSEALGSFSAMTTRVLDSRGKTKRRKVALDPFDTPQTIQVIVGTYEKVLHGLTATVLKQGNKASEQSLEIEFADTFLLSAHASAIRSLAISPLSSDPTKSRKVILASGGSDQIINLYHISAAALPRQKSEGPSIPTLAGNQVIESTKNRELGSLEHHSGSINALYFPVRSKLLSAAEDNTIAVARTRDWTVLSTIKAPIPKAHGRPSGDTAPLGGTPAGVNDFAIHPSMKLMVSVGKGEKCMRLWNLVTGKKAGALNFERELLRGIGEGRWASGEGRRVEWDSLGEEFVVGFERGCVVFGMDSKPKCRIVPSPSTKIHQMHYLALSEDEDNKTKNVLAVSTEDGRIMFYSTGSTTESETMQASSKQEIPLCEAIGQLGGAGEGLTGRIKDFEILKPPDSRSLLIVTGNSDGAIRLWLLDEGEFTDGQSVSGQSLRDRVGKSPNNVLNGASDGAKEAAAQLNATTQVGTLIGTYEVGNRITCLKAFIMLNPEALKESVPTNGTNGHSTDDLEEQDDG